MAFIVATEEWYGTPLSVFRTKSAAEKYLNTLACDAVIFETAKQIPDNTSEVFVVSSEDWYGSHYCSKCCTDFQPTLFLKESEADEFITTPCVDFAVTKVSVTE